MAKRKRLELSETVPVPAGLETKSTFSDRRMPIAEVAGDVAGRAALEEVAQEMTLAEDEGRIVKKVPLSAIETGHLIRDRLDFDEDEMEALRQSIGARGQQTPIEVVRLEDGRFGLISGLRRVMAMQALGFERARALIRRPNSSQSAYQAMVEENEMRANLSFYERAHIAVAAAGQGVYPDATAAVKALFAHVPKAKRSKIGSFVVLCEALGPSLRFPARIPEHLGLALVKALKGDPGFQGRAEAALRASGAATPEDERKALEQCLKGPEEEASSEPSKVSYREVLEPGLVLDAREGRVVLSGPVVDGRFVEDLRDWIARR